MSFPLPAAAVRELRDETAWIKRVDRRGGVSVWRADGLAGFVIR